VDIPELIQHPAVLAELSYALSPVLHEGKLQPYGFMAIKKSNASVLKSTCEKLLINLPEARVADGCHGFSIFKEGQFHGVFIPKYAAYTELVQLQQELNAIICMTDTSGVTKLFAMLDCLFTNIAAGRRSRVSIVLCKTFCAPQADSETLKNLLEFCFHDLSPQNWSDAGLV